MDSVYAHSQEIIGRADALARGLKRYFTGKSCKHGHVAERYVNGWECIACNAAAEAKRRAAELEKYREYRRARYAANSETIKRLQRERRAANPEGARARNRGWKADNPDKARAHQKAWRSANPEKSRALDRNKRAHRRAAEGRHTAADIAALLSKQGGKCGFCSKKLTASYHVDHVQPLAKGGSNWPSNLQILCPPCNLSKHAKDPIIFAQENGRLL